MGPRLGVAEAMDTAQRGMGVDGRPRWNHPAFDRRGESSNGPVFSGCGTDQLDPANAKNIDDVIRAYEEQIEAIEGRRPDRPDGLARAGQRRAVAGRLCQGLCPHPQRRSQAVIIHWLGDMFDPELAGYWGSADLNKAMNTAVEMINAHAGKVDGVKISLFDKDKEIAMRRQLKGRRVDVYRRRLQ